MAHQAMLAAAEAVTSLGLWAVEDMEMVTPLAAVAGLMVAGGAGGPTLTAAEAAHPQPLIPAMAPADMPRPLTRGEQGPDRTLQMTACLQSDAALPLGLLTGLLERGGHARGGAHPPPPPQRHAVPSTPPLRRCPTAAL